MKMKATILWLLLALLVFSSLSHPSSKEFVSASDDEHSLHNQLNTILANDQLKGTITGVSVRHAESGEVLYSQYGDTRLRPASNMKLLTGVAALETLGKDYRFSTEVLTDGTIKGKMLKGNLYLKGKGDPTLLKADLDQFAKDLKAKGIEKINGQLFGDDTWYDNVRLSQDLNWSDEPYYTGAQVSALTLSPDDDYDTSTLVVEVNANSEVGKEAKVTLSPETDYVTIVNRATTVEKGQPKKISIEREHGSNQIIIEGTIPLEGVRSRSWVSVWEPTGYVMDVFKKSLQEQGIALVRANEIQFAETPEHATLLTSKQSMPLEELLIPFMKLSNNGHGEMLTKEMGKVVAGEGSWTEGLKVIQSVVTGLGVNGQTIRLRDGSGMSHQNFIPANDLTQLLFEAQQRDWFAALENSLPIAGDPERMVGGTLSNRMKNSAAQDNARAKTGSLSGVATLSGYVTSADGEPIIFSILIDHHISSEVTDIADALVIALAEHQFH